MGSRQTHTRWPDVDLPANLWNVSGSSNQDGTLLQYSLCLVTTEATLYVCTDATLGSAAWEPAMAVTGDVNLVEVLGFTALNGGANGLLSVGGAAADGSTIVGNPVPVAGVSGSGNVEALATDTDGHLQVDILSGGGGGDVNVSQVGGNSTVTAGVNGLLAVGGPAANGAAASGNPLRVAGKDGTGNTQDVITDTDGHLQVDVLSGTVTATLSGTSAVNVSQVGGTNVVTAGIAGLQATGGAAAENAAVSGNPVLTGGRYDAAARTLDNGDVGGIALDVAGRTIAVGPAADGVAVAGNPIRVAGKDGSGNTQDVATDTDGHLQVDVLSGAVTATLSGTSPVNVSQVGGNAVVTAGVVGLQAVGGAAADGAAVSGNPIRIGGRDGAGNTQDVITDTDGHLQVDVLSGAVTATLSGTSAVNVSQVGGNAVVTGGVSGLQAVGGAAAENAAVSGSPVLTGGRYDVTPRTLDSGDVGGIALDIAGRGIVVGSGAHGAAVAGSPVRVAGKDGTGNTRDVATDTDGHLQVDVLSGTVTATISGTPTVSISGTPSTNLAQVGGNTVVTAGVVGLQAIGGAAAENAVVAGNPILVGGRYDSAARTLGNGDVGGIALDVAGRLIVVGREVEDAAVSGGLVGIAGRYDLTPRSLDDGDAGGIALDSNGRVLVSVVEGSSEIEGTVDHDEAVSTQKPVVIGAVASVADPSDVDTDDDVVRLSADPAGYLRVRDKGYDPVTTANRVALINDSSDRYEEGEWVDATDLSAATRYYPSDTGLSMTGYRSIAIQGVISGGVTATIEATLDDSSTPDFIDITAAGYDLASDSKANASFIDTDFMIDYEDLRVKAIRVKSVTSDASNGVQYHYKRTRV